MMSDQRILRSQTSVRKESYGHYGYLMFVVFVRMQVLVFSLAHDCFAFISCLVMHGQRCNMEKVNGNKTNISLPMCAV